MYIAMEMPKEVTKTAMNGLDKMFRSFGVISSLPINEKQGFINRYFTLMKTTEFELDKFSDNKSKYNFVKTHLLETKTKFENRNSVENFNFKTLKSIREANINGFVDILDASFSTAILETIIRFAPHGITIYHANSPLDPQLYTMDGTDYFGIIMPVKRN